jgi:hypothetical protein
MISCALGRSCAIVNEFTVGTITSLLPFATSAGCLIPTCCKPSHPHPTQRAPAIGL